MTVIRITVCRPPADAFVAHVIGMPPMNLLAGVLAESGGGQDGWDSEEP